MSENKLCKNCHGYGYIFESCPNCKGSGVQHDSDKDKTIVFHCWRCYGSGFLKDREHSTFCERCNGKGYIDWVDKMMRAGDING